MKREIVIFNCDCEGFRRGNGIWFDSQDAQELNWTSCPACHKPFDTRPGWEEIQQQSAMNKPHTFR